MKHCLFKDCKKEFEPNKPKQVFCSAKCRVYFSRSLKPKKRKIKQPEENFDNSEIEKQIADVRAEIKPAFIEKSKFERYQAKKIAELQLKLK